MTKILIVDDEESIRFSFHKLLTNEKYEVDVAVGLSDAKTFLSINNFDAAIVDRILANGQNGLDLVRYINSTQPTCETIVMSAYPTFRSASETIHLNTFAYLTKPIKKQVLCEVVRGAVETGQKKRSTRLYTEVLQKLFDQSQLGVVVCDYMFNARFVNPAFIQMFGYQKEDIIGKRIKNIPYWDGESKKDNIINNIQDHPGVTWELKRKTTDDREIDIVLSQSICQCEYDYFTCVLVMIQDVSAQKRLERNLQRSQKMESLGFIAGGIAHDLNNVIMVIMSYADMMKLDISADSPFYKNINEIINASSRADILLKQILMFSKSNMLEKKSMTIWPVVRESVDHVTSIMGNNILLKKTIQKECGKIIGDSHKIYRMVMNILLNAYEAIGDTDGSVEISVASIKMQEATRVGTAQLDVGTYTVITIVDTGVGMDEKTRERMFERFFTTKKAQGFSGLGLSIVKRVVDQHEGAIQVESKPGEGTCVKVYLPMA